MSPFGATVNSGSAGVGGSAGAAGSEAAGFVASGIRSGRMKSSAAAVASGRCIGASLCELSTCEAAGGGAATGAGSAGAGSAGAGSAGAGSATAAVGAGDAGGGATGDGVTGGTTAAFSTGVAASGLWMDGFGPSTFCSAIRVEALTAATRGATAWRKDFDGVRRTTLCAGSTRASPVRGLRMRRSLRIAVSNLQMPGRIKGAEAASRLIIVRRVSRTARDLTCGMPAIKASSLISRLLE